MEEQKNIKEIQIGTIEKPKLDPKVVEIVRTDIEFVEKAKSNKLVCFVKHPDAEEEIKISSAKVEVGKDKVKVIGTWINLDSEHKLEKNSATAKLLRFLHCDMIKELDGKACMTTEDDGGFLCFKAY